MRRSAAPSLRNNNSGSSISSRFCPPTVSVDVKNDGVQEKDDKENTTTTTATVKKQLSNGITIIKDKTYVSKDLSTAGIRVERKKPLLLNSKAKLTEQLSKEAAPVTRYFNVMWCKMSNRKHKRYNDDAVLVVHGKTALLQDCESKDIGRKSNLNHDDIDLKPGQTLLMSGKEIEIISELSQEHYFSGQCFISRSTTSTATLPKPAYADKNFKRLKYNACSVEGDIKSPAPSVNMPRHDPYAPGAIVMPRPIECSSDPKRTLVDVVVDPYISQHLREHQRDGVKFLYRCVMGHNSSGQGAILADEMGLGKTIQVIALLWTLLKQSPYSDTGPVCRLALVICPSSLVKNWAAEFRKWLGNERLRVFDVNSDNKVTDYQPCSRTMPVMIVSYEMLRQYHAIVHNINFDIVICDEGHRLKNEKNQIFRLVSGLRSRRRIILTGTPIQNDLQEFFCVCDFVNPGVLGSSACFKKIFASAIVASRQSDCRSDVRELGEARSSELRRIVNHFVLRRTQEVNQQYLPPKSEFVVMCQPTKLQVDVYRSILLSPMLRRCLSGCSKACEITPHLSCIVALKKLCNTPELLYDVASRTGNSRGDIDDCEVVADDSLYGGVIDLFPSDYAISRSTQAPPIEHSGKLIVLFELLEECKRLHEKVVVVSHYTQTLSILNRILNERECPVLILNGSTPAAQRQSMVDRFNSPHMKGHAVFLLSSKAGGVGLNLVGAARLVQFDCDWNPAIDLQSAARVWRPGQKRPVFIYKLITVGSIEEKIFQRQMTKQGLQGLAINDSCVEPTAFNVATSLNHFSLTQLRNLFTLREGTSCETHDLMLCSCAYQAEIASDDKTVLVKEKANSLALLKQWRHYHDPSNSNELAESLLNEVARCCGIISFIFGTSTTRNVAKDDTRNE